MSDRRLQGDVTLQRQRERRRQTSVRFSAQEDERWAQAALLQPSRLTGSSIRHRAPLPGPSAEVQAGREPAGRPGTPMLIAAPRRATDLIEEELLSQSGREAGGPGAKSRSSPPKCSQPPAPGGEEL